MSRSKLCSTTWLAGTVLLLVAPAANPAGPLSFYPLTPCRVVDTRGPAGTNGGPALTAWQQRNFRIQEHCGVPAGAEAAVINVTVFTPGEGGWVSVFPSLTGYENTSTVNFNTGEFALANGATATLSSTTGEDLGVLYFSNSGAPTLTHLIIDVNGYYK